MEARQEIETANEMRAVANNGGRRHRQVRTSCLKAFYVPPKPSHEAVAGDKTGTQVETGKLARGCALQQACIASGKGKEKGKGIFRLVELRECVTLSIVTLTRPFIGMFMFCVLSS
jgi:hypothetical protein